MPLYILCAYLGSLGGSTQVVPGAWFTVEIIGREWALMQIQKKKKEKKKETPGKGKHVSHFHGKLPDFFPNCVRQGLLGCSSYLAIEARSGITGTLSLKE